MLAYGPLVYLAPCIPVASTHKQYVALAEHHRLALRERYERYGKTAREIQSPRAHSAANRNDFTNNMTRRGKRDGDAFNVACRKSRENTQARPWANRHPVYIAYEPSPEFGKLSLLF